MSSLCPASSLAGHESRKVKLWEGKNSSGRVAASFLVLLFLVGVLHVDSHGHGRVGLVVVATGHEPGWWHDPCRAGDICGTLCLLLGDRRVELHKQASLSRAQCATVITRDRCCVRSAWTRTSTIAHRGSSDPLRQCPHGIVVRLLASDFPLPKTVLAQER
ncbi:hypothetical protein ZWY2020_058473 [Hordeum vulgare]|nr:hypothetical protein ZWY2020_058473 [Hordeum vulgare]